MSSGRLGLSSDLSLPKHKKEEADVEGDEEVPDPEAFEKSQEESNTPVVHQRSSGNVRRGQISLPHFEGFLCRIVDHNPPQQL